MKNFGKIFDAIEQLAPIENFFHEPDGDKSSWVVQFKDNATQAQIDAVNAFIAAYDESKLDVPEYVTRYQFKRAVLDSGQLANLKAAYPNLTDEAKLYWDEADRVGRNSILITELQAELGISDNAVDTFFKNAGKIKP